ncbi:hypothetical protein CV014_13790 [Nostoc sp. CMAA1605]|nr:hypothetical protein [Nostoc sp. CMAA1605]
MILDGFLVLLVILLQKSGISVLLVGSRNLKYTLGWISYKDCQSKITNPAEKFFWDGQPTPEILSRQATGTKIPKLIDLSF